MATKEAVLNALQEAGRPEGAAGASALLGDEHLTVRYAAAKLLWTLKTGGHESDAASAASSESDPHVKAWLLAYLVSQGSSEGSDLKEYADVRDETLRHLVIEAHALGNDVSVVDTWKSLMEHDSWKVRLDSARGMTRLARPEDVPALITFLEDDHVKVRAEVAHALRRITNRRNGFQGSDSKPARAAAIQRWKDWWIENAYSFDLAAE